MSYNQTVEVQEKEVLQRGNQTVNSTIFKNVFNMPVWELRHCLVSKYIEELGIKSVLDIGCAEGKLINRLSRSSQIQYLAGIDFDEKILQTAQYNVEPELIQDSISYNRKSPLLVQLYKQNILEQFQIQVFHNIELVTLIQFIEHIKEDDLDYLCQLVFGKLHPKHVIITTPNKQFNVHFKFKDNQMRHKDHIFQWDRGQFAAFCSKIGSIYWYEFKVFGVGQHINDARFGDCSQGAIFTRKEEKIFDEHKQLKNIKPIKQYRYPFWKDNMKLKVSYQISQAIQRYNYQGPEVILQSFTQSKIAKKILKEKQKQESREIIEIFGGNSSFTIDWLIQTVNSIPFCHYCSMEKYCYYQHEESQESELEQMHDQWYKEVPFEESKELIRQQEKEFLCEAEIMMENDSNSSQW